MDTGLNIRPGPPVGNAPARVAPPPERQTAASELPETKAVTAAADDAPVQFDNKAGVSDLRAALNAAIDTQAIKLPTEPVSRVVEDQDTKELIFRKISPSTGQVIKQYPEEAMLRLKAYNAQLRREALLEPQKTFA
jgi:phage-related baseplate assembly protein